MMRLWFVLAVTLAACDTTTIPSDAVWLTVTADVPITGVSSLRIVAAHAGSASLPTLVDLQGPVAIPPDRTLLVKFAPDTADVQLEVDALSGAGEVLARAVGVKAVPGAGARAILSLVLEAHDGGATDLSAPPDAHLVTDAAMQEFQAADSSSSPDFATCTGPCQPGLTAQGSCDPCSQQVCGPDCQWSPCQLKPGNACEYRNGHHTRPCTCSLPCSSTSTYFYCLSSCQWDTRCLCTCFGTPPGNCSACN